MDKPQLPSSEGRRWRQACARRRATSPATGGWGSSPGSPGSPSRLVILQFDQASITTVGVLVGLMFAFAGLQNIALASVSEGAMRWVSALFAVLFLVSAVVCFISPEETFVGMADMLGFLFLLVGVWWMVRAFLERAVNPLWWLTLISGILMTALAFWTAGQFFIEKAYVLLVFAGHLGADAGHHRHRARVRGPRDARGARAVEALIRGRADRGARWIDRARYSESPLRRAFPWRPIAAMSHLWIIHPVGMKRR